MPKNKPYTKGVGQLSPHSVDGPVRTHPTDKEILEKGRKLPAPPPIARARKKRGLTP